MAALGKYYLAYKFHVNKKVAQELQENPKLDKEARTYELSRQYGLVNPTQLGTSNDEGVIRREPISINLNCVDSVKQLTIFAIADMVKGVLGLILCTYISISLVIMTNAQPDFVKLKKETEGTEFVYIFTYGETKWGIMSVLLTLLIWHILLLVFGIILQNGLKKKNVKSLLRYYAYTLFTTVIFILPYIRLAFVWNHCRSYCDPSTAESTFWNVVFIFYTLSFVSSIYCMTILHRLCQQLSSKRHRPHQQVPEVFFDL